jgi:hypothetical protein
MKRWFSILEICLVHIIIALTIPTLFIGCGQPPAGALFSDRPRIELPPEVPKVPEGPPVGTQDEILRRKIIITYTVYNDDPDITPGTPLVQEIFSKNFYELYFHIVNEINTVPGARFTLTDGFIIYYVGDLVQMVLYLQVCWGALEDIQPHAQPLATYLLNVVNYPPAP